MLLARSGSSSMIFRNLEGTTDWSMGLLDLDKYSIDNYFFLLVKKSMKTYDSTTATSISLGASVTKRD